MSSIKPLNNFETSLLDVYGDEKFAKIQKTRIGIGGAGGLGSNVAVNLVRCGFTSFVIADFDVVNVSNLNRQFFFHDQINIPKVNALEINLQRINSNVEISKHICEVNADNIQNIFENCDILVEAFDNVKSKTLFVNSLLPSNKLIVSVSGLAGWDNSDDILIHKISPTFFVVGDLKNEVNSKNPPLSPRVSICAAKQADIVLSYVLCSIYI